ncbi:PREDICTED: CMP-N-acetylneuraminate-poly-alpha-2,8-sialyltransferase-like isoform X1 [Branchiostoma belcheri]|uniref:CMP-N-acetylneuraminate-poly-alpha-2, 8-sialyltransferase-like isoform X1 n=1 Tax=Branchiostoma belcheri TaxID=7741 RepID=A0A6P4Z759_BRABE|nr:PREDICTED: CMP-N-acetylneuraminate-poly-alpha-2,8-sialyltransferase-like isoform X1 [Branchiostoma belcheri]
MADRKTCFRLMALGLLFATSMAILISIKIERSHQVSFRKARITSISTVSPQYRTKFPTNSPPMATTKAWKTYINESEVQLMRKWVMKHFNPDKDLALDKFHAWPGQRIKYALKAKRIKRPYQNITQQFYRLLPKSSPLLGKHFKSCAVVGNSGILLGSRCGPQIDSADFVFRCNLPAIEGFEKDVGTKSNFTTMNPSVLPHDYEGYATNRSVQERLLKRFRAVGNQILHIPALVSVHGRPQADFAVGMIRKNHLPIKITIQPSETTDKIDALWEDSEFKPKRASTGSILFALAACVCDQIHMYGFYPFAEDDKGRKIMYHYYGSGRKMRASHNMSEEQRMYQKLHQRKALVLHTEPCR